MSGRALTYVAEFFGTDSTPEVLESTLWTPYRGVYWESVLRIGSCTQWALILEMKQKLICFDCCEFLRLLRLSETMTLR
jgi:hypothetical protein